MEPALKIVKSDKPQRAAMAEQYFQIPNSLIDSGMWASLSEAAKALYPIISRKTIGWGKQLDSIAIVQLKALSGIKKDETVSKAIAELERHGLIEVFRQKGALNKYKLILDCHPHQTVAPLKVATPVKRGVVPTPNGGGSTTAKKGATKETIKNTITKEKTYTHTADAGAQSATKSQAPAKPKKPSAHSLAVELLMSHGVSEQVASDYMQVRKAKRAGILTETAMNLLANQAKGARLTVEQAVLVCIERNWVGFNADWLRNSSAKPTKPSVKDVPVHTVGGVIQGGW